MEFSIAENATAEGLISTKDESQTDNSVIYLERAYKSSLDESLTWGGSSSNR